MSESHERNQNTQQQNRNNAPAVYVQVQAPGALTGAAQPVGVFGNTITMPALPQQQIIVAVLPTQSNLGIPLNVQQYAPQRVPLYPPQVPAAAQNHASLTTTRPSLTNRESTFPVKLHQILSKLEFQDIITWLPHGRAWKVLQPKMFEEQVIPLYFRLSKYASFMRQVNGWGFKRVTDGPEHNSYHHEMFLRDRPELCEQMTRNTTVKRKGETKKESRPSPVPSSQSQMTNSWLRTLSSSTPVHPLVPGATPRVMPSSTNPNNVNSGTVPTLFTLGNVQYFVPSPAAPTSQPSIPSEPPATVGGSVPPPVKSDTDKFGTSSVPQQQTDIVAPSTFQMAWNVAATVAPTQGAAPLPKTPAVPPVQLVPGVSCGSITAGESAPNPDKTSDSDILGSDSDRNAVSSMAPESSSVSGEEYDPALPCGYMGASDYTGSESDTTGSGFMSDSIIERVRKNFMSDRNPLLGKTETRASQPLDKQQATGKDGSDSGKCDIVSNASSPFLQGELYRNSPPYAPVTDNGLDESATHGIQETGTNHSAFVPVQGRLTSQNLESLSLQNPIVQNQPLLSQIHVLQRQPGLDSTKQEAQNDANTGVPQDKNG